MALFKGFRVQGLQGSSRVAPGLIKSRVFEDAIHTPTCSNGVLLSLALSLSVSVSVAHSSRYACVWFCQARAAQQGQTRVTLGSLHIRALEDTIHAPTCWNGVLPSPSLSLSLSSSLHVSRRWYGAVGASLAKGGSYGPSVSALLCMGIQPMDCHPMGWVS